MPLTAEVVGPLTREDVAAAQRPRGSKAPAIKRLSDRHHSVARSIAAGMAMHEVAAVHGMSASRISILKDDPSFKELVEFYREKTDAAYADMHERLAGLSLTATAELAERLDDEPEKFSAQALMDIVKLGADRTGYGPASKNTQVNINVNLADRLEAARKRVADARQRTIEHEVPSDADD